MISEGVILFCSEPIDHIENYDIAIADKTQTWPCHHKLEISLQLTHRELIKKNLYYNRPANELIFMTPRDHCKLHNSQPWFRAKISAAVKDAMKRPEVKEKMSTRKGKPLSPETKRKMSEAQKKIQNNPEVRAKISAKIRAAKKGKPESPEHKAKISAAKKGCIYVNNGNVNKVVKAIELENYLDNGWVRGMVKRKK